MLVPGATPTSPVLIVVSPPSKEMADPALRAKSTHVPRGISMFADAEGAKIREATESTVRNIFGDMVESRREIKLDSLE